MPMFVAAATAVAIAVAVASVPAVGPLRRWVHARATTATGTLAAPARIFAGVSERTRLWLAATLLDLGNHLMLSAEERRAYRLRRRLTSPRARRLGAAAAALRAGARRLDDVALEIPIGERPQEGNPRRTLALSCVVYESPGHYASDPPEVGGSLFWRVVNRPPPGHRGPSVTVDVPDLDRALISYYARPLRLAGGAIGARFFDEGTHEGPAA
jgi:hypothetical protein